jgi:sugar lactone lactonase YvrE
MHVDIVEASADELGEGPVWLPATQELLRVDIARGQIVVRGVARGDAAGGNAERGDTAGGNAERGDAAGDNAQRGNAERRRGLGVPVGFALPISGGGFVAGAGRTLVRLADLDAEPERLAEVEGGREANRFNDAACDPRGRLWAGTMSTTREPGAAALYRIEPGGAPAVALAGVTLSNGLDWSLDATRLYYVDSVIQRIDAIDFDVDRGRLGRRRPFANVAPADGLPDGLTVDAEGGVWLALFGGAAIRRYRPDGALDAHIPLPVTHPTSLAFGGPDLDDLYVTSARRDNRGGALLRLRPGVRGRPATQFGG